MITGIIFVCLVEEGICQPVFRKFDTVQECNAETTKTINGLEYTPGMIFYSICDPDSEPL